MLTMFHQTTYKVDRLNPENTLFQIIYDVTATPVSQINHSQRLHQDLGMDSMAILTVGCEMEKAFRITITDDEIRKSTTVNDLIQLIIQKLNPVE